ncbi:MAG: SMC-Scp complex subunit ScpB [Candidatus Bathyarchaeota archaeon]|nr:MAG: SMC-Scp complex subunit ScpB [Candidatus Bathyarchaeota archaeon]
MKTELQDQDASPPTDNRATQRLAAVEAALYVAGRPLDLKTLASIAGTRSKNLARKLASTLKEAYAQRNTSLEILELPDERFVMQLKPEYSPKVQRLSMRPLLTIGPLKTLSYIAYRQPVAQKQVLQVRGNHVYSHLKQLEEMGLIRRDLANRRRILRTTEFFADYFGFSHELRVMKRQMKKTLFQDVENPTLDL